MAKKDKLFKSNLLIYLTIFAAVILFGFVIWYKNWQSKFEAPRQNTSNVQFTIGKNFTLDAVVSDLKYYDFIKNENVFKYALEHTTDNTSGNENSLKIGGNTIDREAVYTISQSMTAWEIADILLNQGEHSDCDHGCPESNFNPGLLPGGDLAPTLKEKYYWVKTYEQCIEAKGQLSSEQYAQRTGIRRCVSPDGREFTQGKEGWADQPSP